MRFAVSFNVYVVVPPCAKRLGNERCRHDGFLKECQTSYEQNSCIQMTLIACARRCFSLKEFMMQL